MSQILAGCRLEAIESATCRAWLDRVTGQSAAPGDERELRWLLAHCDDGVVWGRLDAEGWRLSDGAFPEVSPSLGENNVQQFRLFGPQAELLVWRTDDELRGRWLTHASKGVDAAIAPQGQEYILLGDRVLELAREGFTLVGDGRGSRHAVPLECDAIDFPATPRRHPLRLAVWHYFVADVNSGIARIAASRLADVRLEKKERN